MEKCCFIIPYYGKLPDMMPIFIKSCAQNPDFSWLIFTDDTVSLSLPKNVRIVCSSLSDFRSLAEKKLGFPIRLDNPYKLCDFKPAYGFLFEEYLTEYPFWGYCDLDVIMGRLGDFLTDELLAKYDKLFCMGHMTLFRNTPENNRIFMCDHNGISLYRQVFSNPEICWFDEEYQDNNNINQIFLCQSKRVCQQDFSLNMYIGTRRFRRVEYVGRDNISADVHGYITENYVPALYYWDRGRLMRFWSKDGKLEHQEYLYMHLQYRSMRYRQKVLSSELFRIVPNQLLVTRALPRSRISIALTPKGEFPAYRLFRAGVRLILKKIIHPLFKRH